MTISFPLTITDFADLLRVRSFRWTLDRLVEHSGTRGGGIVVNEIGVPRWRAEVELAPMSRSDGARTMALFEAIGATGTFNLYNTAQPNPIADPDGSILGSSNVSIETFGANYLDLRLENLPAGYVLTAGDMLHFNYGSSPVRRSFHRIVETVTAAGDGSTPDFEVRPHLPAGIEVGTGVDLKKPAARMMMVPGTLESATFDLVVAGGMSFTAMQVI